MLTERYWLDILCYIYDLAGITCFLTTLLFLYNVNFLPKLLRDAILYGKYSIGRKSHYIIRSLEVPKRWFTHFYAAGSVYSIAYLVHIAILEYHQPRQAWIPALALQCLQVLQVGRRLYECLFVSVFSRSTMNIAFYLMGYYFYLTLPTFVYHSTLTMPDWNCFETIIFICLILTIQRAQYNVTVTMANLRKTHKGEVSHTRHVIPQGGLFHYVSSPHYLLEILDYGAMLTMLGFPHKYFTHVWLFVALNQFMLSVFTHTWYITQFPHYPKDRKAFIPFIY